jgi:dipeptidyl aminopeptidase/acylaminoacyl peptidase
MDRWLMKVLVVVSVVLAQAAGQTAAQTEKRPFTFEDMMALKRIGDPVLSPDGKWVMFSATDVDLDANKKTTHLWIIPISGGAPSQVIDDPAGETRGRFSPDEKKILFASARGGSQQIWVADFDPDHGAVTSPRAITRISTEADGAIWSPDGKNILFTSEVYPGCGDDLCNKTAEETRAKSPVKAMIFTHLLFRHWNHFTNVKRSHLFVVPADGGVAKDITPGNYDVPPFSLGGQDDYAISPDGKEVAYTSNHDAVPAISTNNDIFVVPITGGQAKKISTSPGGDSTPVYSPDGKWLAWRMQVRPGYESDRFRLVIYDRKSGQIHNLTENVDRWVESITWSPNSKSIYFVSEDKGEIPIYVIDIAFPNQAQEVTRGANDELQVSADGKTMVFTRMSVQAPSEIYKGNLTSFRLNSFVGFNLGKSGKVTNLREHKGDRLNPVQLTRLNDAVLSSISMPPMEPFWFTGAMGAKVEGFLIKPPQFKKGQKYPVKFLIHGGPQGAWGDEWSYRWNAELFAANGYVVIMINPRGSTGYGQKFIDEINGDWGGKPYIDLMKGLDYAEKTFPFIDKNRECALGASYGGYMINWILGHTNRFKCLVSHDGIFDTDSAYGSTEELWFPEWEFKGMPWTNRAMYRRWSPHLFATQFKTPTLVVHGQLDYRLDVSQGFALFTTLQRLKVPSKMLYFPDEGHWVLKPQNSRLWYHTVNGWVAEHVQ